MLSKNDFGNEKNIAEDSVIFALAENHFLFDGNIGATNEVMMASRFDFNTTTPFNITHKLALSAGSEHQVHKKAMPPRLIDENGRQFELWKCVWMMVRFSHSF